MMAFALAVAAQFALQDRLTLLGVAGYVVAAWLFVTSVRRQFDSASVKPAVEAREATPDQEASGDGPAQAVSGASRLGYVRHNWRLLTMVEIFRGDIPPARLQPLAPVAPLIAEPVEDHDVDAGSAGPEAAPPSGAVHLESWQTSDSSESSPTAVKVTPQGDVLVLDTGLGQVQRFDQSGHLLATYALEGGAGLEVLDLDVSPDGRTLYIVDNSSKRLQVISLTGDEASGEEE
jgi:DNA-binding beta-propeller fold protein YncE